MSAESRYFLVNADDYEKYCGDIERFGAWVWLLGHVNQEGKLQTSYASLARAWGLSTTQKNKKRSNSVKAKRITERLSKEGRLTVTCLLQSCPNSVADSIEVSISNYSQYQLKTEGPVTKVLQERYKPVTKRTRKKAEPSHQIPASDFRKFTDHIWVTYEEKYGVKPVLNGGAMTKRLKPFLDEYGLEQCIQAWDSWIESDNKIATESNHSVMTFGSNFCFTKALTDALKNEVKVIEKPYRDVIPERKSRSGEAGVRDAY